MEVRSIYRLPPREYRGCGVVWPRRDHGQGCAHVSAEFSSSSQGARLSGPYGNEERPPRAEAPPREGAQAPHCQQRVANRYSAEPSPVVGCEPVMPGFDRSERVRRRVEYQRIYDKGVKVHGPKFTLFRFPNGLAEGRLGIAATRKLGGAVARNRAKRLIREVFRRNKLAPGFDIVIVPRRELLETSLVALEREFRNTLERSARRAR